MILLNEKYLIVFFEKYFGFKKFSARGNVVYLVLTTTPKIQKEEGQISKALASLEFSLKDAGSNYVNK